MEVIDSEGRLFGVVNIVDALVVLLVLAVVVAGAALVFTSGDGEPEPEPERSTTHVTLDLGTQPESIADAINEGDRYSPSDNSDLTVTDVHVGPASDGVHVVVRAELDGPTTDSEPTSTLYDGAPPRLGRELTISTPRYNATGNIRTVGEGSSLATAETTAVIDAGLSPETADDLTAGTEVRLTGRTVATIDDVYVAENDSADQRRVTVLATLHTHQFEERSFFGTSALGQGGSVIFPLDGQRVTGDIVRVAPEDGLGRDTQTALVTDVIDAEDAGALAVGDTYTIADNTLGTVESVTVYGTGNPDRKRVYVGLTLETLTIAENPQFGDARLREGATIPFRTEEYELAGNVVRVGATEQRGTARTRTVTLQLREVRPERAQTIREGMVERAGGKTIARLTDIDRKPSQVVLTSESGDIFLRDHPVNRDLTISAELAVRETTTGVRFKGETIQPGATVTLDLGETTVQAEVVSL